MILSIHDRKAAARAEALKRRDEIPTDKRIEKSIAVGLNALSLPVFGDEFLPGTIVSGFSPIRSEVDIRPMMATLAERGARLCLPVVVSKEEIVFRDLVRGAPLVQTGFGTVGPGEEAEELDPGILLVPLSAFDRAGGRLGYGAGYYDRAVSKLQARDIDPLLIGVAFAEQEMDDVPMEPHDRALDHIVTDLESINVRGSRFE